MQGKLAAACEQRMTPNNPDAVRSAVLGSLAELVSVCGTSFAASAAAVAQVALREMATCETAQNRHHGVFALGALVRPRPQLERPRNVFAYRCK